VLLVGADALLCCALARLTPLRLRARRPRRCRPEARATCDKAGKFLPVITNPQQNSDVRALLPAGGASAWLGLTDLGNVSVTHTGGGWMWVDGNVSRSRMDPLVAV